MSKPIIEIQGIGKRYSIGATREPYLSLREQVSKRFSPAARRARVVEQEFWALKDVTFSAEPGEAVGIIGRNGAGKSTLLKILSQITPPTEGRITMRGRVGSLLEVGTGFHPELTGRENIYMNGAILGMSRKEITRKFDEIVAFAEMEKFLDTPVKRYSSGMYVRLAFAVAAHLEPEILVVDEVLAVGDAEFQKKCLGKMGEVAKGGRTVLFVSHNLTAVRALCSRVVVIDRGKVWFDGSPMVATSRYLETSVEHAARRIWDDEARALGGEGIRCREVRVRDAGGSTTAEIDVQQPFRIEVEYEVLGHEAQVGVTLLVYNSEGVLLFSSMNNRDSDWHGRAMPTGRYRSVCGFPGDLLNGGEHTVTLIVWTNGYRFIAREDDVVRFNVHDTGGARGDYMGGIEGAVRPVLEWRTEEVRG